MIVKCYAKSPLPCQSYENSLLDRTMLHETLGFSPDAIEAQLGHRVPDRLGTAYNWTQHLEERKRMMQAWADYLDGLK